MNTKKVTLVLLGCGVVASYLAYDRLKLHKQLSRLEAARKQAEAEAEASDAAGNDRRARWVSALAAAASARQPQSLASNRGDEMENSPKRSEDVTAAVKVTAEEVQGKLHEFFRSQNTHGSWAPEGREQVSNALRTADIPATAIRALDCRDRVCLAEIRRTSLDDAKDLMQKLLDPEAGWRGPMAMFPGREEPDGIVMDVFFAPEGSTLPLPPAANGELEPASP